MKTMQEFFYTPVDNPQEVYENLKTLYDGVWITSQNQVIPIKFLSIRELLGLANHFLNNPAWNIKPTHWENWKYLADILEKRGYKYVGNDVKVMYSNYEIRKDRITNITV